MKIIYKYKRVKILMLHCGICNEQLSGNGSMATLYTCSCGSWENSFDNLFEYTLKEKKEDD